MKRTFDLSHTQTHLHTSEKHYISHKQYLRVDVRNSSGACSTAHRLNRPDHWDGLMLDKSAVGQISSLSNRTK